MASRSPGELSNKLHTCFLKSNTSDAGLISFLNPVRLADFC